MASFIYLIVLKVTHENHVEEFHEINWTIILLPLVPNSDNDSWKQPLPTGLIIVPNILSMEEEAEFIQLISSCGANGSENEMNESCGQTLKHREVNHFGYEFLYGKNNVDINAPLLDRPIPTECDKLWTRLGEKIPVDKRPDQLTVNKYQPGQGSSILCSILIHHLFLVFFSSCRYSITL